MNIIFIESDYRKAVKNNQNKIDENSIIYPRQVYKETRKKYKVGDFLTLTLQIQPYASYKNKILYLEEKVLAKVININKNVISIRLLKDALEETE